MAKNVQLTVDIKGSDSVGKAAEKTKSLKQELRELKQELASGNLVGKAFDEAAKKAGQLEDTIGDVNQRVKNLASDTGKLDGFVDLATGITGGFAAAQGAMALFGEENEDLQKSLVKIQGAVALLNGVQAVANTLNKNSAFLTQLNVIKTKIYNFVEAQRAAAIASTGTALQATAVKARLFGLALAATGIGVAIIAVGFLAEKFGVFGDSVDEATKKLKESQDRLNEYAEKVAELDSLSIARVKRETDLAKARLKLNGATNDQLLEQDKKYLLTQKAFLEMQIKDRAEGSIEQQKAIDKLEDLKNQIAIKDIERQTEENNLRQKDEQKRKELAEKRQKEIEQEEKNRRKSLNKAKQDASDNLAQFEEEQLLRLEKKLELEDLEDKANMERENKIRQLKEQELAEQLERDNLELQSKQNLADAVVGIAEQTSGLLNQVAGKNKAIALTALAIEKGAAIADVVIKGIRERAGITAKYSVIPGGQALAAPELIASGIRTGLSVATITATGINNAKSISGSGSGGSVSVQPPNIRGTQSTNPINPNPINKVIVTETDIRNVTRRVDGIYTQATIQ